MLATQQYAAGGIDEEAHGGSRIGDRMQIFQRLFQRMTLDERITRAAGE